MRKKYTLRYEMMPDQLVYVMRTDSRTSALEVMDQQVCLMGHDGMVTHIFDSGFHRLDEAVEGLDLQSESNLAFFISLASHDLAFGMQQPVYVGDEMIKLRALGNLRFRINAPRSFIRQILSEDVDFRSETLYKRLQDTLEEEVLVFFRNYLPVEDHFFDIKKVGVALKTWLNKKLEKWGIYIDVLTVRHLTMPSEIVKTYESYEPCPVCHKMMPPNSDVCQACGHKIGNICNQCGRNVVHNYCPDCGTPNT